MSEAAAVPIDTSGRDRGHARLTPAQFKRAVEMRSRRVPIRDIAAKIKVPKSTIHKAMAGVFSILDHGQLAAYRDFKPDLLEAAELKMLSACMDDEAIAKASLNNRAYALTQVHQLRRLETGQSTANLALHELVESVERDHRARSRASAAPVAPRSLTDSSRTAAARGNETVALPDAISYGTQGA